MSSLPVYSIAKMFSTVAFWTTIICNLTFIYLTMFHVKKVDCSYKNLLNAFASFGIFFSIIEMHIHPFFHSFNHGLINFNMEELNGFATLQVAAYSGVYVTIVSFFTILLAYRYWTITGNKIIECFVGWKIIFLISWAILFGIMAVWVVILFGSIDDYSREYLKEVMMDNYGIDTRNISGYSVIAYDHNGNLRWNSVAFSAGVIILMGIQFLIVGIFGVQMHFRINFLLKNVSKSYETAQRQFFKSLIYQITSPTLTFYIPAIIILTVPFLDLKLNFPTGIIVCSFSIYPPIDSLIMMTVVSAYRVAIKKLLKSPSTTKNNAAVVDKVISLQLQSN